MGKPALAGFVNGRAAQRFQADGRPRDAFGHGRPLDVQSGAA
jgi:hypothetical protein